MVLDIDHPTHSHTQITQAREKNTSSSATLPNANKTNGRLITINKLDKFYTLANKKRILKSYYNKDASASVNKSFLALDALQPQSSDESVFTLHTQITQQIANDSESLNSCSFTDDSKPTHNNLTESNLDQTQTTTTTTTTTTRENFNTSNYSKKQTHQKKVHSSDDLIKCRITELSLKTSDIASSSCISFLNRLVDKRLDEENNSADPNQGQNHLNQSFSKNEEISDETLETNKADLKENKETSSKDLVNIGVKFISKILTNGSFKTSTLNKSSKSKSKKLPNSDSASSSSYSNISTSNSLPQNPAEKKTDQDSIDFIDSSKMDHNYYRAHSFSTHLSKLPSGQQLFLLSKKFRPYMPFNLGLKNHGNTCFMNCVLQCLFHTSPLAEYFVTGQFERDIQNKSHQLSIENTFVGHNQFILTRYFSRLLYSTWRNGYESNFSLELKHIIGCLNPTFAGGNQNDSHELCIWLLDKLSQELTIKIPVTLNEAKFRSSSFLEELFQVHFKSTVICSRCNYRSSKDETDMMLSLPLPTTNQLNNNKNKNAQSSPKLNKKRSLYPHLLLSNQSSIKHLITSSFDASIGAESTDTISSRSKFYIFEAASSASANDLSSIEYSTPFHAKIGVNLHNSIDEPEDFFSTNGSELGDACVGDLRRYLSDKYNFARSSLVFLDLNRIQASLNDYELIAENFLVKKSTEEMRNECIVDSLCVIELVQQSSVKTAPLINVIGINVYYESGLSSPSESERRCVCYGLPFVLLINRDCSYSELCRRIIEAQSKYFKDKNTIKYKDLFEKLFCLSVMDADSNKRVRISSSDELPLYAECVEKAIQENHDSELGDERVEYVKLNIEWRSFLEISNFFKDIDYGKPEFVHKSVKYSQKSEKNDQTSLNSQTTSDTSHTTSSASISTLDDCFELFTEQEELSDENSWMCPNCHKQTNAYKKLCISEVPPILIIHLKRFFYKSKATNFKITSPIWFPVCGLDMNKYLDKSSKSFNNLNKIYGDATSRSRLDDSFDSRESYPESEIRFNSGEESKDQNMYDLFGVCNHQGQNMLNGHYTAYCKNFMDTRWYSFDDANCSPMFDAGNASIANDGSARVFTENAYILFYKKRNCMSNEKWWLNFLDASLLKEFEFSQYIHSLNQIEREQQKLQMQQQDHQLKKYYNEIHTSSNNNNNTNNKKNNGFKTLKKLLNGKQNSESNFNQMSNQVNIELNHYDEKNKPKRVMNPAKLTSTFSDPSGTSYMNLDNVYYASNGHLKQTLSDFKYEKDLEKQLNDKLNLYEVNNLNYPNDNDYTYSVQQNYYPSNGYQTQISPDGTRYQHTYELYGTSNQQVGANSYLQRANFQKSDNRSNRFINTASIETPI